MKKLLAIILSVVMLFSVMATVYVSGNATYSYNTVQDFNGFAENEINRSGSSSGGTVNDKGVKTIINNGSISTTASLVSNGELITYGKDDTTGLKMWANAANAYLQAYVPVTAEMRSGAVGYRVWVKNRSMTVSDIQLRFYAKKDGKEYVYRKPGYTMAKGEEGYIELFFNDAEISKFSQTPSGTAIPDLSVVPEVSEYNMSEHLTYVGLYLKSGSSGVISVDNFEIISSDAPVEEDTTVPTEPEEETTTTTTTTTTVAPETPSEEVEILKGGEWVQGFWSNGVVSTADTNHKKRAAYNVLLKVKPNTVYTFKTKTNNSYANSINVKEHNANKEQVANTNLQTSSLGANFTKKFTTTANTHYLGVTFWGIYENNFSDTYAQIKALLDAGSVSLSIVGPAVEPDTPVEQDGLTTTLISTQDCASIRLNEVNGMRFYATVDAGLDLTTVEEMGIIIAPNDIVGDYFTMDDDHIKVVYDHKTHELWSGNQFVGSIVNVADRNLARDFIARAYVVIDGVTYYAEDTTVRNIADIADAYIADANGGYTELDDDTKALVEKWAAAND